MMPAQPGLLAPVPAHARYLFWSLADAQALPAALRALRELADGEQVVVWLGPALVTALGTAVPGLREMPDLSGPSQTVPVTPSAMCCWLRGGERGALVLRTGQLEQALAPALRLDRVVEGFRHGQGPNGHGRDLTGYEDGTENPDGEAALAASLVQGAGPGLDGGSFVALQQWQHDFAAFARLGQDGQDLSIGRRSSDNEELVDAPASAHVRRTAQEDFEPEAFVLRRSMPWTHDRDAGLIFVALGCGFEAFEAQMRRMSGQEDGLCDALFTFSRPITGAYYWAPPLHEGRLDLRRIGL